jgi:hypothetical protein
MIKYLVFILIFGQLVLAYDLLITEIMYDPEGNDQDREWIEVVNNSSSTIFIAKGYDGWRLNDGQNHLFKNEAMILPGEIFIIASNATSFKTTYSPSSSLRILESKFNLKNTGGEIKILDKDKNIISQASYSSSFGAKGNGLSLNWDGDKWREGQASPGFIPNLLILSKSNKDFLATKTELINSKLTSSVNQISPFLIITEFFPNPDGNDTGQEFVELYNPGNEVIDLQNFWLEINNKKEHLSGKVKARDYFLIKNKQSIRNSGEKLIIFWQGQKVFEISYQGKAPSGMSFARDDKGQWHFTQPTPGKENIFNNDLEPQVSKNNFISSQINFSDKQERSTTSIEQEKNWNQVLTLITGIVLILIFSLVVWLKI